MNLQFRVATRAAACVTVAILSFNLHAQTGSPYFPTDTGSTWTFNNYTGTSITPTPAVTMVAIGYEEGTVNGVVPTLFTGKVGEYDAFTTPGDQVLYHGTSFRSTGTSGVSNITSMLFFPPIVFDKLSVVGTTWSGSGTVSGYAVGVGSFSGTYSASTSINSVETITTPAGTFSALKVSYSRTVAVPGTSNWVSSYSFWLVKGVGIVKLQSTGTTSGVVMSASNRINSVSLTQGWNLVGNPLGRSLAASDIFAANASITTVWRWNSASGTWAFYSPALHANGTLNAYAASKGYTVLQQVDAGEGFWINAASATSVLLR